MTAPDPTTRLDDRYGRRSDPARGRRRLAVAGGVALVAAVAWIGWVAVDQASVPVRFTAGTFTPVDDGTGTITFTVTTDPGRTVVCTLRAFNAGLTEVGRIDVEAGPSSERSFRVTRTVPTFERADAGTVQACAVR